MLREENEQLCTSLSTNRSHTRFIFGMSFINRFLICVLMTQLSQWHFC